MDDIFGNAKTILIIWTTDIDQDKLSAFQNTIQTKAKTAEIASENVKDFLQSRRALSSIDLILFDLLNKKDSSINTDLVTQFFRILRSNGHLLAHIEHSEQGQIINNFKMCGFNNCNQLDANPSFLMENKSDDVKKLGSLWLCQKPSFDIGYSVPLQRTGVILMRQISGSGRIKKMWTVDHDDSEDDTNDFQGDVPNFDNNTKSFNFQSTTNTLTSSKSNDRPAKPMMSDV